MSRHVTSMTIEDAEHYTPEQRAAIIASYPAHEREARTKGIPTLGSGRVFPVPEESITCNPFQVPDYMPQVIGIDLGWDHPFAACKLAHDRDNDIIYVTACYTQREATPPVHAQAIRGWGDWIPVAWPHDGLQHDKGSGQQLAEQYRRERLNLLPERATFEDGSNGLEAGVMEMLQRMQSGRWKVFSTCGDWFGEFRLYRREKGIIVKERDDAISASRYGMMSLRYAITKPSNKGWGAPSTGWVV